MKINQFSLTPYISGSVEIVPEFLPCFSNRPGRVLPRLAQPRLANSVSFFDSISLNGLFRNRLQQNHCL